MLKYYVEMFGGAMDPSPPPLHAPADRNVIAPSMAECIMYVQACRLDRLKVKIDAGDALGEIDPQLESECI